MALCSSTITRTAGASATLFPVFLKHFLCHKYPLHSQSAANFNPCCRYYRSRGERFFQQRCNDGGGRPAGGAGEDGEEGACGFPGVRAAESSGQSTRTRGQSRQNLKVKMRPPKCQPCSRCVYRRLSQRGPPSPKAEVTGRRFEGWFGSGKVEFCPEPDALKSRMETFLYYIYMYIYTEVLQADVLLLQLLSYR